MKTIQAAADMAEPGDTVIVHEGIYRERVSPSRGGESEEKPIVFMAAKGENVEIKGSEVMKGWKKVNDTTWEVGIPNKFSVGSIHMLKLYMVIGLREASGVIRERYI